MNTREDDITRGMLSRIRAAKNTGTKTGFGIIKEEKETGEKAEITISLPGVH